MDKAEKKAVKKKVENLKVAPFIFVPLRCLN